MNSCENASQSKHPAHPYHCYNGHRYQYSCPYTYGREQIYNGYRCVQPYHCPNTKGNYVIRNPTHSHQYFKCANGMPSLYTCSRGFAYDDRRGCCVFDEHQKSGYFGYRVGDSTDPTPNYGRVVANWYPIPGVDVPIDRSEQDKYRPQSERPTREPDQFQTERIPDYVVVKPIDQNEQDRFRPQPDRVTREPDRIQTTAKTPTLPVNEPCEVRYEHITVKAEEQTKATSTNNDDYRDEDENDDNGLDDDDEDYNDDEEDDDGMAKFRRSIRDWQIDRLI